MVDVGDKSVTARVAVAESTLFLPEAVMRLIGTDGEIHGAKGPVFATAIIAGTMGAKRTHDLIPFCHPLGLESCKFAIEVKRDASEVLIRCTAKVTGKTGVEMEALTGASVAALAVYDMCKAVSHDMAIVRTHLVHKSGGKSVFNRDTPM